MFKWQNPNFTWTMLSDIKGISNDHILLLSKRLFQRSLNHRMDVVLRSTGQQMAQPHFLQLVLLRGTDVEERCYNVSECSKECDSQMRRQNRVEKRDPHSSTSHPDTLEKKIFEQFLKSPQSTKPGSLSWLSTRYSASSFLSLTRLYLV